MYKSFKLTKRIGTAFHKFPKTAKEVSGVYNTGIHKMTDTLNSSDTYFFVLGLFRIMLYVDHKHKRGHTCN